MDVQRIDREGRAAAMQEVMPRKFGRPWSAFASCISLVLRHRPDSIGVILDAKGWIDVDRLLAACSRHGKAISRGQLEEIVRTNDKRRFAFSADGLRIRANQGHSIEVDLELVPIEPPELLFHGTVARFLPSICREGLVRGKRHHVHLSPVYLLTSPGYPWVP